MLVKPQSACFHECRILHIIVRGSCFASCPLTFVRTLTGQEAMRGPLCLKTPTVFTPCPLRLCGDSGHWELLSRAREIKDVCDYKEGKKGGWEDQRMLLETISDPFIGSFSELIQAMSSYHSPFSIIPQ